MIKFLDDYRILWALIGLCAFFSLLTLKEQTPSGEAAVNEVTEVIESQYEKNAVIIAVGASNKGSADFANALAAALESRGFTEVKSSIGSPQDFRKQVGDLNTSSKRWLM